MKVPVALASLAAALVPAGAVTYPSPQTFRDWFGKEPQLGQPGSQSAAFSEFRRDFIATAGNKAKEWLNSYTFREGEKFEASEYPYFNVFPQFVGAVGKQQKTPEVVKWEAPCFKSNVATAKKNEDGSLTISIRASEPASWNCYDTYLLTTTSGIDVQMIYTRGEHTVEWELDADMSEADLWDTNTNGVRIFKFLHDLPTLAANFIETFKIFIPELINHVSPSIGELNVDFLEKYTHFKYPPRDEGLVIIPEDQIKSGDFFGIVRLDGLDPMLAWGMGSTTGHVTVAMWMEGELYVMESTVEGVYWPTDGIQKTPYRQWVKQAMQADFHVVHVPLSEAARANFNEEAALDFFRSTEGLEYGYHVMLWGWLDTISQNFPCLPPDYSSNCLQWELVESLFALIDKSIPQLANLFWNQAWNHRLGTSGLTTAELFQEAGKRNMKSIEIPIIPEQDSWVYNTTRYGEPAVGKAMVCCVFVCNIWKAAGVFGDSTDQVNCGELTNYDDYVLDIFQDTYTQMMGKYDLTLNDFNTKDIFPHMAEHCPSFAPDYEKPADC